MHIFGWNISKWCRTCFNHWESVCGQVDCDSYRKTADQILAHELMLEMESGQVDIPTEILNLDLSDMGIEKPRLPRPSDN